MKKLLVVLMLLALTASISFAMPITVQVTRTPGTYQAWVGGGEFTITPVTGLSGVLTSYDSKAKFNGGFQSFCLETQELHSTLGVTVDATLSTKAINGGVGPAGDPISKGTAFLYYNFAKGTLAGYDYTGPDRSADAVRLQRTIWWLEEENPNLSESTNEFGDMVKTEFGSLANAKLNNDGPYSVGVLNITENGELKQSMLVVVPAPGALLLAGMGVSVVGWLRRKQLI